MDSAANLTTATPSSVGLPVRTLASRIAGGESMGDPTRLEAFMKSRGIKPLALARVSGYSRQYLLRVRKGRAEPSRPIIAAIVDACRKLSHEPVKATDLFDLGGE
jgi:hypothetical protein